MALLAPRRSHTLAAVLLVLWLPTGLASASRVTGTIKDLYVRSTDGVHYVVVNGTPSQRPTCAGNTTYYMIRDETSDVGKAQLAMLLSAYMAGKPVWIEGTDACTRWSDGEDIHSVAFH
ncbi:MULTISPECIES: hypothetical protein [Xanthomonas]|uniref:hypothetical protein n=1 Tax=Xanthomonas TaxID=338 RepID=UPI001D038105|nr:MULTISPECIES: hypothetical protein [Xanthomonas]MCW0386945.1 hypothetical protein [Xanthomonas sacchari]MDY4282642.1 hypothetical protein [Xanthomonas sp. LF06-19]